MFVPAADHAGDPSSGGLSFSATNRGLYTWTSVGCEWIHGNTDAPAPQYFHDLAEFYLEAARRLPIADIPDLANCISDCGIALGIALGLADPVTNIILTTIEAFAKRTQCRVRPPKPDDALEKTRNKATFAVGTRNSHNCLGSFLMCYFRNLTCDQAEKCLVMAGYHLPLAVRLIEVGRWCSSEAVPPLLQPDAARTKTALQQAAKCSNTNGLIVWLMTWRFPRHLLDPDVLDVLRGGKQLTADCVYGICDLLRRSWPQPPTPAPTPGTYQDGCGNVITITMIRKDLFSTTTVSKDLVATTTFTSTRPSSDQDDGVHLSSALATDHQRSSIVKSSRLISSWRDNPDFLPLMKMSLLDTVHGFYIDALGMLPSHALRDRHLLRAVLAAGHCYGPLDPVSNIILNSIWYDAVLPLSYAVSNQIGPADILDARSMTRVESRSLDGLVAFARYTYSISEQEAVVLLCQRRFNLSDMLQGPKKMFINFASAAVVAKHPQPAAFLDFLKSLTPAKLVRLRSLISDRGLSGHTLERLKKMVTNATPPCVPTPAVQSMAPDLGQSALETLSARREAFKSQQDYVRAWLENLLLDYGRDKGHLYRLGIVCGVTKTTYRPYYSTCYHVNFLASRDVPDDSTRSWTLFFAEFWSVVGPNVPFCCPVRDSFDAYSIRCIICDHTSCKIAHPSCDEYVCFTGNDALYGFPVHYKWGSDLGGMFESDFIYFDRESDEEFANILSEESSSSSSPKKPRAREEFPSSERKTRATTGAGFSALAPF